LFQQGNNTLGVRQIASEGYEAFHLEDDDVDENEGNTAISTIGWFIKYNKNKKTRNQELIPCSIGKDQIINFDGDDLVMSRDSCPYCNSQISHPIHFRISSAFTNRILSDIILDETTPLKNQTTRTLYNGKKYISFTDSRQGTAKISAMINIDSESNWIRYQVYHYLAKKLLAS